MKTKLVNIFTTFLLFSFFYLINIRSLIIWNLYPPVETVLDAAWFEILYWLISLLGLILLLKKLNFKKIYFHVWAGSPLLVIFILYSLASVFWASHWQVVLHRSLVFLFATSFAVYFGIRYTIFQLIDVFIVVGLIIVSTSFFLAIFIPVLGTDLNPPYLGAWRGIFWHKNHLGNIMPIFVIFSLARIADSATTSVREKTLTWILYVFSILAVIFSESASGLILLIVVHVVFGVGLFWLKIARHLQVRYHILIGLFAACLFVLSLFFVDDFFRLLGKEMSLTGRIPMWKILFREVVILHPWFGVGFGLIWSDLEFRIYMRDAAGWGYPVMIGDNGFIDILLNLGVVGLGLFLLFYILNWINAIRYFLRNTGVEYFLPLIFLVYSLFVNLTYSLFFETEVFVWSTLVMFYVIIYLNAKPIVVSREAT